jgi:hypothetical protein
MATLALVLTATGAATGCDSENSAMEPSIPAQISGRITALTTTSAFAGTIRVETVPTDNTGTPKAIATVDGQTVVLRVDRSVGEFRSLAVGQWVRVWFDGPVQESYPVRGVAGTVVIDSSGTVIQ